MKFKWIVTTIALIAAVFILGMIVVYNSLQEPVYVHEPYALHGALSVDDTDLVDIMGNKYRLKGVSTHGVAWFPEYINEETFHALRDSWNADCVRLALYTASSGGYCTDGDQEELKKKVCEGIDIATELSMYVIVDWHVLSDENPLVYQEEAVQFFDEISGKYKDYSNVIYEICNEPNGDTTWEEVKEYADSVIPVIRENDPDCLIIVGTPDYSSDLWYALEDPLEYDNVMYSLHFYAGTHKKNLRDIAAECVKGGLPVFVSEYGISEATGKGVADKTEGNRWKAFIEKYGLSCVCWNLSNKAETCALIDSKCSKMSGWKDNELTEQGRWVRNWYRKS